MEDLEYAITKNALDRKTNGSLRVTVSLLNDTFTSTVIM